MNDAFLNRLERAEKLTFAVVVYAAKIITWLALLLLALTVEATLVVRVFEIESDEWHFSKNHPPGQELHHVAASVHAQSPPGCAVADR